MTPTKLLIGQILIVLAIVLIGVWAATQWAAAMLGYQPQLGLPWFEIHGIPVYRPWRSFPGGITSTPMRRRSSTGLERLRAPAASRVAARRCSARYGARASRAMSPPMAPRAGPHGAKSSAPDCSATQACSSAGSMAATCATTDASMSWPSRRPVPQGRRPVVPTLLSWTGSAVVHDIKGENWTLTAGWRARFSHCLLFNPTDARSARYNPLLEVRRGVEEVRDVQNIADILVDPEGALERRNHWEKTSHSLLVGAILHILYTEEEKTLARVATFLSDPQRSFVSTLQRMMTTNHLGTDEAPLVHPVVASAAREVLNKSENERSGVLSTAMSFLGLYRDPTVAEVTSRCDWRIADLVDAERPVSLYLVIPPSDISRTKPLSGWCSTRSAAG